jgi:hypothetical protein
MFRSSSQSPNMFNSVENPSLSEAFTIAWHTLTGQQTNAQDDLDPIVLQSRIAAAILTVTSRGVTDPTLIARAAIDQCSSRRILRTPGKISLSRFASNSRSASLLPSRFYGPASGP